MNANQQNEAIAKALGWTVNEETEDGAVMVTLPDGSWDMLPDFTGDLNAMAIAERALTEEEKTTYSMLVEHMVQPHKYDYEGLSFLGGFQMMTATAPQRCEAWLKAKSLWI